MVEKLNQTINLRSILRYVNGVVAKVQECSLEVSELGLESYCYVHVWTNTNEKAFEPLFLHP